MIFQSRSRIVTNCRCRAWLPAEFSGPQKGGCQIERPLPARFGIASISRRPVWKIACYANAPCALGAEHASEITHCHGVLSKQIPAYPPARADHLSAGHSLIERNYEQRDEVDLSKKTTMLSKLLKIKRMRTVPAFVPKNHTFELRHHSITVSLRL